MWEIVGNNRDNTSLAFLQFELSVYLFVLLPVDEVSDTAKPALGAGLSTAAFHFLPSRFVSCTHVMCIF